MYFVNDRRSRSRSNTRDNDRRRFSAEREREREREREYEKEREKELERERVRLLEAEMNAMRHDTNAQSFFSHEPPAKIDLTQAILDAVAASQKLAQAKHFPEVYQNQNSNDSASNGVQSDGGIASFNGRFYPSLKMVVSNAYSFNLFYLQLSMRPDSGRRSPAGEAPKKTRPSFLACPLFFQPHWIRINRKLI